MISRSIGAALLVACAAACSSGDSGSSSSTDPTGGVFIAFASDMTSYESWNKFPVNPILTVEEGVHSAGTRIEYINKLPPHGSTEFPIGTIIVKEIHADIVSESRTFAMVKRGGDFNSGGAANWEWFELALTPDPVVITWRGVGPPIGETYGGDGSGGCNTCHGTDKANDFVLSRALTLGNF